MRRRWRWLIGGGAAALIVLGSVAIYLSSRDFNAYRGWVEARLSAELGNAVTIGGDMGLSLGWDPVIVLNDVALARHIGGKASLARIERLEAKIALMPFVASIGRELVVERITVKGAQLWLGQPTPIDAVAAPHPQTASPLPDSARMSVRLRALDLMRATLHFAVGREVVDVAIDRASATAAGDAMRIAATGTSAGHAIRVDGSVGMVEQWMMQPPRPVAIDLTTAIDDTAQLRLKGSVLGGNIDLQLDGDLRGLGFVTLISKAQPLNFAARLQAAAPADSWRFTDVSLKLGTVALTGDATLRAREVPDLKLTLHAVMLDLASLGSDTPSPTAEGSPASIGLDRFTAEIALSAAAATLPLGIRMVDIHGLVTVHDGKAELKEFGAVLARGAVAATGDLSPSGEFTARLSARGVDLGQLMRETRGQSSVSGGTSALQADLRGRIFGGRSILTSLKGRADLSMGRASVSNSFGDRFGFLQIFNIIDRALPLGPTIPVNCAAGRFIIDGGVARTRGLMIDTPRLALWVAGRIDLDTEAIDLRVEPQAKVAALVSVVPPMNIRGTLSRPLVEPDVIGTAVGVASGLLAAPGLLAGEIGDVLSGLGSLVAGSKVRTSHAPGGCQVPSHSTRDTRPGLHIPNLFDLFR